MAAYLDTSALVKLVVTEAESEALRQWLEDGSREPVSCDLARTELLRVVRRHASDLVPAARDVLDALVLTEVTTALFESAGRLTPDDLRSLDALHVAAALDLGDDLDALVTYDQRMAAAATANGLRVVAPVAEQVDRSERGEEDLPYAGVVDDGASDDSERAEDLLGEIVDDEAG